MNKVFIVAVLSLALIFLLMGVIFFSTDWDTHENGNDGTPTPVDGGEFSLSFKFEEGSALFHRVRLTIEGKEKTEPLQVMETVSLIKESEEEYSELEMIVLEAYKLDGNEKKDMCAEMPFSRKKGTVRIYLDGTVAYEDFNRTSFHLPQKKLSLGDSWEYKGIEYTLEEKTDFRNEAGEFEVVRISFDGVKYDRFGTKRIHGYFLFDIEKNLKIKEETIEERPNLKIKSENELVRIMPSHPEEIDYSCVFAVAGLTPKEKYERAELLYAENEFDGSLVLAISAKKELEEKGELSEEETSIMKNILVLIANNYKFKGDKEKEIGQRFENAQFFEQFLSGRKILASDFIQAFEDYKIVSESDSNLSIKAMEGLNDLNERLAGILRGNANLADTGKTEGLRILLIEGTMNIEYELEPFNPAYTVPVLDLENGGLFSALYYRKNYNPKALPPIEIDENTFLGEYSMALRRMDNNSLGFLAGFCYSLDSETGVIKQFNDLNFQITGDQNTFTAQCSNGFYSSLLEPGTYIIEPLGKEFEVRAAETTLAHIVQ